MAPKEQSNKGKLLNYCSLVLYSLYCQFNFLQADLNSYHPLTKQTTSFIHIALASDLDSMLTTSDIGPKSNSKKPGAKASAAAKATLKGVRSAFHRFDELLTHKLTDPNQKGPQNPHVHHLSQTQDPGPLQVTKIPPQVDSS